MKATTILPVLLVVAAFATPASANWFHNPYQGVNRNIGSAPNPTPQDIRENRLPIAAQNEEVDPAAAAQDAAKTANAPSQTQPVAQSASAGVVAAASPSR